MTVGEAGKLLLRDAVLLRVSQAYPLGKLGQRSPCLAQPAQNLVLGFNPPCRGSFLLGGGVVLSGLRGAGRKRILVPGADVACMSCPCSNSDYHPQNGGLSVRAPW